MRLFRLLLVLSAIVYLGASVAPPALARPAAQASQTVDRIVARIENDVILLSEVRELAAYQQFVDGHAKPDDELVRSLIEQWVVRDEARQAQFPMPAPADVDAEISRIQGRLPSPQDYRQRLAAVGLTEQALRRIVEQQIYLERYLDYKFRPAIQIEDAAISKYYEEEFAPAMRSRGQAPPPLDDVREQIREVLIQRAINERADAWFEETKSRLEIDIPPALSGNHAP